MFTVGVGFTVIVNVVDVPGQPLAEVLIVMVAVIGALVLLIAENDQMLPVPEAARPIDGVLFVQLNVVPATPPLNATTFVVAPLHNVWLLTALTVGVGFTVMVKVVELPGQPLADVLTVMVAVIGALVLLIAVNDPMLPVPEAAKPIVGLLFVQL